MDKDAPNIYKGATVYFDVEVQGMQYRNTSDAENSHKFPLCKLGLPGGSEGGPPGLVVVPPIVPQSNDCGNPHKKCAVPMGKTVR